MKKLYFALIFGVVVSVSFFTLDKYTRDFISKTAHTLNVIKEMENYEHFINSEIIKSAYFLYHSYDNIYDMLEKEEKLLIELRDKHLKGYPKSLSIIEKMFREFHRKKTNIEDFETINSIIKNSLIYIPTLSLRYLEAVDRPDAEYMQLLHMVESYILIIRRSLDISFLEDIKPLLERLKKKNFEDEELRKLNDSLLRHLSIFVNYYPEFLDKFTYITSKNNMQVYIDTLRDTFAKERNNKAIFITYASTGFSSIFIIMLIYVAYLLLKVERSRLKLLELNQKLQNSLFTDELTGLPNRLAFYSSRPESKRERCLILINIDGFKRVNDVYGSSFGDSLLVDLGKFIKTWIESRDIGAQVFRLGADDFGILIEDGTNHFALNTARELVRDVENHTFVIDRININLDVSAGVSCEEPLLEKADMAMKHVKSSREKVAIYTEELGKNVERNLNTTLLLKEAIVEDRVVLHFQKVVDTFTGKTHYYECLVRIKDREGKLIYPGEFLEVAKESKHYRYLTQRVLSRAFEVFKHKDVMFSVNISAEDISDKNVSAFIYELLSANREITNRLIFEILESESIKNYEEAKIFFENVRNFGAKLAIDDFGSGYSNFSHIAELYPDFIKIDGTLIEGLIKSRQNWEVVATIVEFCKRLGIESVAEFVSNANIYERVKKLGIAYSQGFYISKPSENID